MRIYTIGYGGRAPQEFVELLKSKGVRAIVDVRLRPDRAAMGAYARAKTPDKGIERLLAGGGIRYFSFVEMGNLFLDFPDWADRYRRMLSLCGELLTERLGLAGDGLGMAPQRPDRVPEPFCLMCAEKKADDCHRKLIADFLAARGHEVEHIE
jgi:uncharacterized protein (DUF488 family)